uniref:malate synthase n=1 Tax=Cyprinus carpio carpio TaxID=630221 RepID=A0A9J8BP92_CYPCA
MHSWRSPLTLFGGLSVATYDVDITVISREIDFDDGKCPIYHNHMKGIYNAPVSQAPVLMLRVPGPLFDFGLLMFHNAKLILQNQSGPFFYLSKVSSYIEARLWSQISFWTEKKLGLPAGCIKATVLIECVPASFEMEILYELKEHSAGLNCGIWDYSASFVNRFGHRADFLLPDHSKYVDMEKRFLHSYMDLLVQTCHRRGALATGGMAALLLPGDKETQRKQAGVDGFMVYDMDLIEPMQKLFQLHSHGQNQLLQLREDITVTPEDLLIMPAGGVTLYGLRYNIAVGVLFIEAWLSGRGHFFYLGKVEDSATVWQWIRHQVRLEDDRAVVTRALVSSLAELTLRNTDLFSISTLFRDKQRLMTAVSMFLETVLKNDFPEFLTTYLNLDHTFHSSQS